MYELYENFLPKENYEEIKRLLLSESFPWTYNGKSIEQDNTRFFMHDLSYDGDANSKHTDFLNFPAYMWIQQYKPGAKILRSHVNFQLNGLQGSPHVDSKHNDVTTLLYYVTTSDGPTNLYDGFVGQNVTHKDIETPVAEIPHTANTMCSFDSHRYHVGVAPSKGERINIAYMVR